VLNERKQGNYIRIRIGFEMNILLS